MYSKHEGANFGLKKKFYPNGKIKGVHSNEMGIRWNEDGTVSSIYYNKDDNNGISVSNNIDGTSRVFIRIDGEEAKGKFDEKFLFMKEKKIVLSETLPLNNPDTRNGYNKVYYPNGNTWIEEFYVDGKRSGKCKMWSIDGHLLRTAYYKDGFLNGESVEYDLSGNIKVKGSYLNGVKDGEWKEYYPGTTQLWSLQSYKEGAMHGVWANYYENGDCNHYYTYANDKRNGIYKGYHYIEKYCNF